MGVNNISHYNDSHTATPIHHQPSCAPPPPLSLPSTSHFPSVFTPKLFFFLPLPYDLITPFTSFSLAHFLSPSVRRLTNAFPLGWPAHCNWPTCFRPSISSLSRGGLKRHRTEQMWGWKSQWTTLQMKTSAVRFRLLSECSNDSQSNNNLGKFLELFFFTADCERDTIVGSRSRSLWKPLNAQWFMSSVSKNWMWFPRRLGPRRRSASLALLLLSNFLSEGFPGSCRRVWENMTDRKLLYSTCHVRIM